MIAKVFTSTIIGVDAVTVEVEVDLARGLPSFSVVGVPDVAVKESKDRIRSAIKNSAQKFPGHRITINLAPADLKKEGTAFDLPMAVGILAKQGIIDVSALKHYLIAGELSLNGKVKPIRGALPMAIMAKEKGFRGLILPKENAAEAAVVSDVHIFPVTSLAQTLSLLNGEIQIPPYESDLDSILQSCNKSIQDFSDVRGQEHAKRALEVASAGGHNLLMVGPPGSGKTMLARRLPTILPVMSFQEYLDCTRIYSVYGKLQAPAGIVTTRPFRSPHHTISDAGIIGGGTIPKPGEVSLAHNGVLFLDEFPEFRRNVLESLRQPMEDGCVTISRAVGSLTFPACFMLVASMNPCPCGYFGDKHQTCRCLPGQIERYRNKISGPLMDRIDIQVEFSTVPYQDLTSGQNGESSMAIQERVNGTRKIQERRYKNLGIFCNAQMNTRMLETFCSLDQDSAELLKRAMSRLGFSARVYHRILKVARTIADLSQEDPIHSEHIAEAIQYRCLDRVHKEF